MTMQIAVCVKQVIDTQAPLRILEGTLAVVQDEPRPVLRMDPAARAALEEAMALQEHLGAEITALTVGPPAAEEALRICLARGVDRALHVICSDETELDAWHTSQILAAHLRDLRPDLILCGDRSLDHGSGVVGPTIAELLNLAQITRAVRLDVQWAAKALVAWRLLERGDRAIVQTGLPAVVCVMSSANEPRYVSVHRRMRTLQRPIERVRAYLTEGQTGKLCEIVGIDWPRPRPKKIALPDASMSAAQRMQFLMTGGRTKKKEKLFSGSAEEAAERVIELLQEKGIL